MTMRPALWRVEGDDHMYTRAQVEDLVHRPLEIVDYGRFLRDPRTGLGVATRVGFVTTGIDAYCRYQAAHA